MEALHTLTEQYSILMDCLYDDDYDEETLLDTLEGIEGEIEAKADNYARIMQRLNGDAELLKKEEERLSRKRRTLENRSAWLKNQLYQAMKETGKTKFKTDLFSFGIQKNGGKAPMKIDDPEAIPEKYLIPQPPKVDMDAVRKELENGVALTFAHLEERGESLRIR